MIERSKFQKKHKHVEYKISLWPPKSKVFTQKQYAGPHIRDTAPIF